MHLHTATIKFPEIQLAARDAHKLRGYFGNLFKEKSELLHNHYADGSTRYKYPLVQYKVIKSVPTLLGVGEGARLLINLFLKIRELNIENTVYPVHSKNIKGEETDLSPLSELHQYRFETLWMALNQKNYELFQNIKDKEEQNRFLNKQLINNVLSFYKGIDYRVSQQIMATGNFKPKMTNFKNKKMLAFEGTFVSNAVIPDGVGIGKAVSRGFGTVCVIK